LFLQQTPQLCLRELFFNRIFGEQPTVQVRKTPEIGVLLVFCEVVKEQWPVEVLVPIFAVIYDFPRLFVGSWDFGPEDVFLE